ncbi:MAG: tyrosine-protein phosphatase [Candidatus Binatia bacterium]
MTTEPTRARHVLLAGAENFRDLGGYATSDGRTVAWGRLFRSSHLGHLTAVDGASIDRLGIRLVCDLRAESERADAANRFPANDTTKVLSLPIDFPALEPGLVRRRLLGREFAAGAIAETVLAAYRAYVSDFGPLFTRLLAALAEPGNLPALFHCNAGKDRTGFATMVVLLALGVPRTTIVEDYLLTNHLTRWTTARRAWLVFLASRLSVRPREMRALLEAREPYLDAAFAEIEARHGSVDAYLQDALGVTDTLRERLRTALLV